MIRHLLVSGFVIWTILIGCKENPKESVIQKEIPTLDTTIFLFNIKHYSRGELAGVIEKINKFYPSVIAISAVFPSVKNFKEDSTFQQSIVHSGRIILCAKLDPDGTITHSNPWFLLSALGEGVNSYYVDENNAVREYQPLFQGRDESIISFPDEIAYHHDPCTLDIFEKFRVNEIVPIQYTKRLEEFHSINIDSLESYKIKGKIVLLADLRPEEFNELVPENEILIKAPSALITANIVLSRLSSK